MWRTPFTEQYKLDVPFVSPGMGFYAVPALVAAVSNAGGLGECSALARSHLRACER